MIRRRAILAAEHIEDFSIALVFSVAALMAVSDILGHPRPPTRTELLIIHYLRFAWELLVLIWKCAPALVPLGLLGGVLLRRRALPALVALAVLTVPSMMLGTWSDSVTVRFAELGAFFAGMLVVGSCLRRWLVGARPRMHGDAYVRWSLVGLDLLIVPFSVMTVIFVNRMLVDPEPHPLERPAAIIAVNLLLLGARWWRRNEFRGNPARAAIIDLP